MFKYATPGSYVSLRAFRGDTGKPTSITAVKIADGSHEALIDAAIDEALKAARHAAKPVFAPPVATFSSHRYATEEKTVDGLDIALELDERPRQSLDRIVGLLGPATMVIASGGQWIDPDTSEIEPKLHAHWRLNKPASGEGELELLKDARSYAVDLIAGDVTHKPYVHPIRWPGSWHRKGEPKLCLIVDYNPDREIDLVEAHDILQQAVKSGGNKIDLLAQWGEENSRPLDIDKAFEKLNWEGRSFGGQGNGYATVLSVIAAMSNRGEQVNDTIARIRDEFVTRYPGTEVEKWDFDKRFRGEFINWFVKNPEPLDDQNDPPDWLTKGSAHPEGRSRADYR